MVTDTLKSAAIRVGYGILASWWLLAGPALIYGLFTQNELGSDIWIIALPLTIGYIIGAVLWYRRGFSVIKNAIWDCLLLFLFGVPGFALLGVMRGLTDTEFFRSYEWTLTFIFPFLGFWWLEGRKLKQSLGSKLQT
jgi:hypothetical protein